LHNVFKLYTQWMQRGKQVTAALLIAVALAQEPEGATPDVPVIDDLEVIQIFAERENPPEITERVLTSEQVYYLPGTNGDVVRAVQNLPGIARPPLNIGQLIVRGTAPEDSAYYLDGAKVPLVFHFAGLSTIVNGEALREVAFLPGNYGVRYGRTLGGVVDLRFDDAVPTESSGYASIDLYQATAFVEQRLGRNTSLQLSGRRSYADAVLTPVLSGTDTTVRAPRYWDASARVLHDAGALGTFDALVVFSDDRFSVVGMPEDPDEVQIGLSTTFLQGRARWTSLVGRGWQNEVVLFVGPDDNSFQIAPEGTAYERALRFGLREEILRPVRQDWWGFRAGVDLLVVDESFLYDVEAFGAKEQGRAWWASPSPYAEVSLRGGPVTFTPGVRLDPLFVQGGYATWSVDPRLSVVVEASRSTRFQGSFGRYSQLPRLREILAEGGASAPLGPEVSWQASLGFTQDITPWLSVEGIGFYNRLDGLIVGREDRFEFFTGPPPIGPFDTDPYANDGTGEILGAEVQVQVTTDRVQALLAATTSRSVRVKRPGDPEKLFPYDQTIVLNALGSVDLGRAWRVGARFRYGTGNPYTPVVNRVYALDSRTFVPIYGEVDAKRLPAFFSMDLRVDKTWTFRNWSFGLYFDVQNVTNTQNVEVMGWTYDYSAEDPVTGLPILPTFGFRADW